MPPRLDDEALLRELRLFLGRGPTSAPEASRHLGISQPAFSRLVGHHREELLCLGRARATRYLARRTIEDLGDAVPVYEIDEAGGSRRLGVLHAVRPQAFYFEALTSDADSAFFEDLPYFLYELRPAGFLGRLIPRRHPELGAPGDIQLWTAGQVLRYATRYGWNLPGNLVLGDEAFQRHLAAVREPPEMVPPRARRARYPQLADGALSAGAPGSSAAGEQPKFLTVRAPGTAVLVKFSPPVKDGSGRRVADLLVAEHVALEALRARGHEAARTQVLEAGGRVFLEVERFDRLPGFGRRGQLSLLAVDSQFVGRLQSWSDSMSELHRLGHVDAATLAETRWRQLFGRLIANSDMHAGNLSFLTRGTRLVGLAPVYDMGPALYAPVHGQVTAPAWEPPLPHPDDAPFWADACAAAEAVWATLAKHPGVSPAFRRVCARNAAAVGRAREVGRLLPGAG